MSFFLDVESEFRQQPYDLSHILYIVSVLLITFLFVYKLDYIKAKKDLFRKIFIVVSLIQVVVFYIWSGLVLGFSLEAGLPIHLCRTSTIMGLYFLFTEDTRVFNALFYTSAFALIAVFYPVNVHPIYTHIIGYSFQVSHLMIVLVWIFGVFVYDYRPTMKILNKAAHWFAVILIYVGAFNYLVGDGEYLYLRGDVNRPFFKEMPDLVWISVVLIIAYIVMYGMTKVLQKDE